MTCVWFMPGKWDGHHCLSWFSPDFDVNMTNVFRNWLLNPYPILKYDVNVFNLSERKTVINIFIANLLPYLKLQYWHFSSFQDVKTQSNVRTYLTALLAKGCKLVTYPIRWRCSIITIGIITKKISLGKAPGPWPVRVARDAAVKMMEGDKAIIYIAKQWYILQSNNIYWMKKQQFCHFLRDNPCRWRTWNCWQRT